MWHIYIAVRDTAHVKIMHTARVLFSFIVIKQWLILTHNIHSHFTAPYCTSLSETMLTMWEYAFLSEQKTKQDVHSCFNIQHPAEYCIASCNNCALSLPRRHTKQHGVSNYQQVDCLFNRLLMLISKKHQIPRYWSFVGEIHPRPLVSPHAERFSVCWRRQNGVAISWSRKNSWH